jgi:hypothetical protein
MISVYYFWGELFKLQHAKRIAIDQPANVGKLRLGIAMESSEVVRKAFMTLFLSFGSFVSFFKLCVCV